MENNFQFTSAAVSDRGLSEKRPQNEDSYLDLRQYGVFAVADGVGGAQAGDVASQMAMEILGEAFINLSPDADPEDTMKIAIERANSAIFQMSQDLPQLASMATTIVALHLSGNVATVGHVGDSRLYRVDASGQLFRETRDHSVVEEEVRAGRMTPEQALTHPSRNVISRALGAEETVNVDIKLLIIDPDSTFMLCSDGITRHIEDWEIAALLASDSSPDEICMQMKEICHSRGAEDNLTAVVVRIPAAVTAAGNGHAASWEPEPEQVTVAAVRPAVEAPIELEQIPAHELTVAGDEHPTISDIALRVDTQDHFSNAPTEESIGFTPDIAVPKQAAPTGGDLRTYTSSSVVVPAQSAVAEKEFSLYPGKEYSSEPSGNGFVGKLLSAAALLIVGALLGIGGYYYFLLQSTPIVEQPPPELVAKSADIPLTAFEESRRLVDKDPAGYIKANAAKPENAEDYYLVGRAFLLTGDGWTAKRSLGEAKNRLSLADPSNAKTLAAEIAMALTIIETPGAMEAFKKEIAAGNPTASPTANVNVSTSPTANANLSTSPPANANLPVNR